MKMHSQTPPLHHPLVHLIGIGGIGMSALARWFLSQKWSVSCSDTARSPLTAELVKEGVKVKIGHIPANVPKNASLMVFSQAIRPQNPELVRAHRLKIRTFSYPEMLQRLARRHATIAVA